MSEASAPDRTARSSASLCRLRLKSTSSYRHSNHNDSSKHTKGGVIRNSTGLPTTSPAYHNRNSADKGSDTTGLLSIQGAHLLCSYCVM